MTTTELKEVLAKHLKWINDEEGGERANLRGADLSDADLSDADLKFNICLAGVYGKPFYQSTLMGNDRRTLTVLADGDRSNWTWYAGCFRGDEATLKSRVLEKYGEDSDYMDAIAFLSKIAERNAHKFAN